MDGRRGSPSRAESAVPAKKTRLGREVGMVIHTLSPEEDYKIEVYVVDLDAFEGEGEEYALVKPSVRFLFPRRCRIHFAICAVESSLYVFGGYNPWDPYPSEPKLKYARKFDLSSSDKIAADLQVMEDDLAQIPKMEHAKNFPTAIPTPHGKRILVFSRYISARKFSGAFELYHTGDRSWEVLPDLPFSYHHRPYICGSSLDGVRESRCSCFASITSYSFLDASHFFVQTDKGSFVLDIENKKWTSLRIGGRFIRDMLYFVRAKGDQYDVAITHRTRSVLGNGGFFTQGPSTAYHKRLPLSPPRSPFPQYLYGAVIPLPLHQGEEERVCNTCNAQVEMNECGNHARFLIDVCRTNLGTLSTQVSTEVSKRLKLRTTSPEFITDFNLLSF